MTTIDKKALYQWCRIPYTELEGHPQLRIPFRLCRDTQEMGALMARELVDIIKKNNASGKPTRAIGRSKPFASASRRFVASCMHR